MSLSMPATSVRATTRRLPSLSRATLDDQVQGAGHLVTDGPDGQRDAGHEHHRLQPRELSRGALAWTVVKDPSWPVFMACNMSRAAPSRTSPTTMRSGRIRRAFMTRSRIEIWPLPSVLDGRDSRRSTWRWCS